MRCCDWGHRNVQRFRGGLVFKAHRLCVPLISRLESKTKEKENGVSGCGFRVLHIRAPVVATCEDRVLDGPASGEKGSKGRD